MENKFLSDLAKQMKNEYHRNWQKKNPEKVRQAQARYWEKKSLERSNNNGN